MDAQRKSETLAYIVGHLRNEGFPPSIREICEAIGVSSTSYVLGLLHALEADGAIVYVPGKNRGIRVLGDDCPCCGQKKPA